MLQKRAELSSDDEGLSEILSPLLCGLFVWLSCPVNIGWNNLHLWNLLCLQYHLTPVLSF